MRQIKSKSIMDEVKRYALKGKMNGLSVKQMYRKIKKAYNQVPRPLRHKFFEPA